MEQYDLLFDPDRCVGCQACEVACKAEHYLPVGISWIRLLPAVPQEVDGKLTLDFKLVRCMHCGKAPCIAACPQGALSRNERGIVLPFFLLTY